MTVSDMVSSLGLLVAHYLQRITPSLALGAEIMYQRGQQVPGGEIAIMSLAGRWSGKKSLHRCIILFCF